MVALKTLQRCWCTVVAALLLPMDKDQMRSAITLEITKDTQKISAAGLLLSAGADNVRLLRIREESWWVQLGAGQSLHTLYRQDAIMS